MVKPITFVPILNHAVMWSSNAEDRYRSPKLGTMATMTLPLFSGRSATMLAARSAAPLEMPTLLGLAGLPIPPTVQGADFSPIVRGDGDGSVPTDGALLACYRPFHEWAYAKGGRDCRGLRTRRYTYCRDHGGPWLLLDNEADPFQMRNVVADPTYAEAREELDAALHRRLAEVGDALECGDELLARLGVRLDANGDVFYKW